MMEEYKDKKEQNLSELTEILKKGDLIFNSSSAVSGETTPSSIAGVSTSPSEQMITSLPDEDNIEPIPSAAPSEEDLE